MKLRLLYFAWIRERIGKAMEDYETNAQTPAELIKELTTQDARYAAAFADTSSIKVAVNQILVDYNAPLSENSEVAFFPPMTGG